MRTKDDNTILLDKAEAIRLCKPGEEGNTCIWLLVGDEGFACHYYNRPTGLMSKWRQGWTVAKRNGCEEVKKLGLEIKYVEVETLEEIIEGRYG